MKYQYKPIDRLLLIDKMYVVYYPLRGDGAAYTEARINGVPFPSDGEWKVMLRGKENPVFADQLGSIEDVT